MSTNLTVNKKGSKSIVLKTTGNIKSRDCRASCIRRRYKTSILSVILNSRLNLP